MSSVVFSQVMDGSEWRAAAAAHEVRAGRYADPFAQRRARHEVHPVEDFLFTYYTLKPGQFKRWHPGAGVILLDAPERASWRFYRLACTSGRWRTSRWRTISATITYNCA